MCDIKAKDVDFTRFRIPLHHKEFPLILFWSQKSGCTTLVKWFFYQIGELGNAFKYHEWVHNYENEVFKQRDGYIQELKELLKNKEKPVYKLVREPYRRAVSSFLMLSSEGLYVNKDHFAHNEWKKIRKIFYNNENSEEGISFKQFLYYLKIRGSRVSDIDGHFAQQYIDGEEEYVTKYVHLENFNNDIKGIEKKYGLKDSDLSQITNSGHHRSSLMGIKEDFAEKQITEDTFVKKSPPKYSSFYDEETISLVREIFKKDFQAFGYDINNIPT